MPTVIPSSAIGANQEFHQSPSTATSESTFAAQFKQMRPNFHPGDIINFVNTNPRILQLAGILAGGALCAVGVMSFINVFAILSNPLGYTLNLYYILFGLVILWTSLLGDSSISQKIYSEFNFLSNARGRGLFYLFVGSLLISQIMVNFSVLYLVVGVYLLLLGVTSSVVAWRMSR